MATVSHAACAVPGFVGSGPLVILADLALRIGPQPSFVQRLALYWFVTAVTCAGLQAALTSSRWMSCADVSHCAAWHHESVSSVG